MKAVKRLSYKQKLLAFSLLMGIVPVLILGGVSLKLFSSTLQEEVDLHQQSILRHFQTQLDTYITRLDQLSVSLASNSLVQKVVEVGVSMDAIGSSVQFINEIQNVVTNSDIPIDISLILTQYDSVYSHRTGLMRQIDYPTSELLKLQWTGSNTFYKIAPNTFQGQSDLWIVRPVPLNTSSPRGILVLQLNMARLMEMVERTLSPLNRSLLVFDDLGRLVASGQMRENDGSGDLKETIVPLLGKMKELPSRIEQNSEAYLLTSIKSSSNGWTYVAVSSAQELSAKSDQIEKVSWALVLGICLVWGAAAVFGSKRLFNPLQSLAVKFSNKDDKHQESDIITALDRTMQDMRKTNERLMLRINEQMPILKEHALLHLIRGELSSDNDVSGGWKAYVEPLQGDWFCVGVVEIDQMLELKQTYRESDLSLIMYALRKLIEEIGEAYRPVLGVSTKQGQVAFLMGLDSPGPEAEELVRQFARSINEQVKQFFAYTVSVALAEPREGYENIHVSYKEAQSFMIYRLAMGPSALLLPEQIRSTMHPSLRQLIKMERAVVSGISQGHYEQASAGTKELVQEAAKSLHSSEAIAGLFVHLIGELETSFQDYGVDLSEVIGRDALPQMYGLNRMEQLPVWMDERIIEPVRRHMEQLQVPKRKKSVQVALALVQEQIESDLSLQQIADELQIPRPTLSKWFKEETGEDFREHLIRVRMDKAKEWLLHADMPIKEISDRLRYTSVPNFTRIFKQSTGMTPGAYRSRTRGDGEPNEY
ncbi:helix-turn-helix domain-containing protein [Paenibacillus sp. MBLB4367]|uniref:helix-turn-helix domain-containing protein n=1 Tax=Paenibacillus sp. MBLB4367 TaxID=3384767 RepID=UPI0039082C43